VPWRTATLKPAATFPALVALTVNVYWRVAPAGTSCGPLNVTTGALPLGGE